MKKIFILIIAVMLILTACNKQPSENETTEQVVTTAYGETVTTADGETVTKENASVVNADEETATEENGTKENESAVSTDGETEKNEKNSEETTSSDEKQSEGSSVASENEISTMKELTSEDMEPEWTEEITESDEPTTLKPISEATTIRQSPEERPSEAKKIGGSGYDLGDGIILLGITSYSGKYIEDGTDSQIENVAAITVQNTGSKYIQYAEITVTVGGEDYLFNATTLLPGTKMTVLECNKKTYSGGDITACGVSVSAEFTETPDTMDDKITVQLLDGVVNIKNISGEDINSTLRVYIKNIEDGVYFGGITYRISVDSIAAGEIKQLSASHVSADNSKVVFVTVAE